MEISSPHNDAVWKFGMSNAPPGPAPVVLPPGTKMENAVPPLSIYTSSINHKESDIVNFIKIQRIKWADHVVRIDEERTTKKVFNAQLIGTRRKGRPNLGWIDGREKDLLVLRTKNWRTLAGRRLAWKRLLEKAKAHPGLSSH
ncbi:uncharacterized protein TNCV_3077941 [Trichonephila clavipes]|nr:uncharacterized protein TNCV_3077941 [Trichonephila clavipes]